METSLHCNGTGKGPAEVARMKGHAESRGGRFGPPAFSAPSRRKERAGVALVLVLSFVVLLTALVLALLSRSVATELVSGASANLDRSSLYGRGAIQQVIGDLRQEINAGSSNTVISTDAAGVSSVIYRPKTVAAAVPALCGPASYGSPSDPNSAWNSLFPNLLKESCYNQPFYNTGIGAGAPNRAAPVSTTNDPTRVNPGSVPGPSTNNRFISMALWNAPLLLPKASVSISRTAAGTQLKDSGGTDTTPNAAFMAPDWILTASDGTNPTTFNAAAMSNPRLSTFVIGRYAYAIYNEGGLLDANAAASPRAGGPTYPPAGLSSSASGSGGPSEQIVWSRKGPEAFADLTTLPGIANVSSLTPQQVSDALVGWRNTATAQASGSLPSYTFATAGIDSYFEQILSLPNEFMRVGSLNGQGDHAFTSRQELISFLHSLANNNAADQAYLQDAMMYLSTFSRCLNQPSYWPDPSRPKVQGNSVVPANNAQGLDDEYNPPFLSIRVGGTFTRNDGSTAVPGEPLVKKRFPLNRLVWITYKGPSANNMTDSAVMQQITALGGNPSDPGDPVYQFVLEGTAANILADFGLQWTKGAGPGGIGGYWTYVHNSSQSPGTIARLDQVAAENREPDFFELLQAGICCGSLGSSRLDSSTAGTSATIWQQEKDMQVGVQVLQIGANMIDQVSPVNFPTHIVFNNGTYVYSLWGTTDLPYLSDVGNMAIAVTDAAPPAPGKITDTVTPQNEGTGVALAVPTIWNPYASSSTPTASGFTPTALRITASDISLDSPNSDSNPTALASTLQAVGVNSLNPFGIFLSNAAGQTSFSEPWYYGSFDSTTGEEVSPAAGRDTAIYFNYNPALYREPTPLMRQGGPGNVHIDSTNIITLAGSLSWIGGIPELGTGDLFLGFYLGQYPIREMGIFNSLPTAYSVSYILPNASPGNVGRTFSLEYQIGGVWIPYRQYDRYPNFVGLSVPYTSGGSTFPTESVNLSWPNQGNNWRTNVVYDPRTNRWATAKDEYFQPFIDSPTNSMTLTYRPTAATGSFIVVFENIGDSEQNLTTVADWTAGKHSYVPDPDGVVRRAMGGYAPSGSAIGLPMATSAGNSANAFNRPIILHRPFRSVAELGYVFSDTPWRNLDFFSPESGDAALLDVFCISEDYRPDAVVAGRVDLNSRQAPVFQSLLEGAYRDEGNSVTPKPSTTAPDLAASEAAQLAQALVARTTSTAVNEGPLANVADLVGRYVPGFSNGNQQPYDGFSADVGAYYSGGTSSANAIVQRCRETSMRALSDAGQAGTWNLLIDLIAQSGRYPAGATGFANFVVEGEQHYWVHVAIDRTTGEVIDENIEMANQ